MHAHLPHMNKEQAAGAHLPHAALGQAAAGATAPLGANASLIRAGGWGEEAVGLEALLAAWKLEGVRRGAG